ncbi:hypothetical protein PMES_03369, partial [Profundibacterium mesophilum KAUST100406-0324]
QQGHSTTYNTPFVSSRLQAIQSRDTHLLVTTVEQPGTTFDAQPSRSDTRRN